MTYTQMNDFVSQVKKEFDVYIGDITVKYLDRNNKSKTAKFNEVSESDDYRFTSVNISFNKDYPTSSSEKTVVFTYSTTADTTASGKLEYVNKFEALNSSASASYSHTTSKIEKTDGNGKTGQTYLKPQKVMEHSHGALMYLWMLMLQSILSLISFRRVLHCRV